MREQKRSPAGTFRHKAGGKGREHGFASHFSSSMKRENGGCRDMSH